MNSELRPGRVTIAGASGLIGRALAQALRAEGWEVRRLVRRAPVESEEVRWEPARGEIDMSAIEGVDAVVNLSGENVGAGRWTASRREGILRSRIEATRTLVGAILRARRRPEVLASASAVGFYGDGGEAELAEGARVGGGFLAEVCRAWETEASRAEEVGVRVALLRFGVVLTPEGGALGKLLPVFRAGLGGRVGSGRQWMSWISLEDAVGAIRHVLREKRCSGPVNVVAPEAVRNAEFASALGRALRRPAVVPVPAMVLRAVFGAMAEETLLASARATPGRLVGTGYVFRDPTLAGALQGKREG